MNQEQAEYLVNTIIRENSFGQIPGDKVQVEIHGVYAARNPEPIDHYIGIEAPGWRMVVREDTPEARMALISMCPDLGKMLRSGEYDEHVREAAL